MSDERAGRPRDAQLGHAILAATRDLLADEGYAALSMEGVAARAGVGKKTVYRRWTSKAPLVAEAVLDAYGRNGSFGVPDTGDLRADLGAWLTEHAEFVAALSNAALIRALVAAAASNPVDGGALYERLSAPQHAGLTARLHQASERREIRATADIDAIAKALMGVLLLDVLNRTAASDSRGARFDGLLDVVLNGVSEIRKP